ncbi:hypothetical protein H4S06_001073, partial [Coemansia sp. BCRC 34490]
IHAAPADWDGAASDNEADDCHLDADPERKMSARQRDARVVPLAELYDSDAEADADAADSSDAALRAPR